MIKPPIKLLQERDFGQKINVTFEFVIQNLKPLFTSLLYIAGPPALVAGVFTGVYQSNIFSSLDTPSSSGDGVGLAALAGIHGIFTLPYLLSILFILVSSVVASLTVYSYMLIYEDQDGPLPTITPAQVWERVQANLLKYVGFTLGVLFTVLVSVVFFVIPAIYLAVVFSLIYAVSMRENLGLGDSMRRCFYLITDKWWSTFGLLIIVSIIQSIIGYVFQIPTLLFALLKGLKILDGDATAIGVITGVIGTVGQILTSCFLNTAIFFQYCNLVERREGRGILGDIEAIGTSETPRTERREEDEF